MTTDIDSAINNVKSSLRSHAARTQGDTKELGKADFLNLFTTQMAHQDPLDPMDNTRMMQQLSQLGTMEQLQNLNAKMDQMSNTQNEIARFEALRFLGKEVAVDSGQIKLANGSSSAVTYHLNDEVAKLKIKIKGDDGSIVAERELPGMDAGRHRFTWDGKNKDGVFAADGQYNVDIQAINKNGNVSFVDTFRTEKVNQVEYKNGKPWFKLQTQTIPATKVQSVDQRAYEMFEKANPLPIMQNLEPKPIKKAFNNLVEGS